MATVKNKKELLNQFFRKLASIIRRGRTLIKDKIETKKRKAKKTIDRENDNKTTLKNEYKIHPEMKMIKDQEEIIEKVADSKILSKIEIINKVPEKEKKIDIQKTDQTMPKLLRIIAEKKLHALSTTMTSDSKLQESEVPKPTKETTIVHVDHEDFPQEKLISEEHIPAKITEDIKMDDSIVPEISAVAIETVEDIPKDVRSIMPEISAVAIETVEDIREDEVPKDIRDETTEIHVTYPQKQQEEESQKFIFDKPDLPSDPSIHPCSSLKYTKDYVLCPQKKSEEKPQKFTFCKRDLVFCPKNYSGSVRDNNIEDCSYKNNRYKQKKMYCVHCHSSMMQCTCTTYSKNCVKTNKSKFYDKSVLKVNSHVCANCCKTREECKRKKMIVHCNSSEKCKCRRCATYGDCSGINKTRFDKYKSQANCINCDKPRNQCYCVTIASVKCHKIKKVCNHKRTMYSDNPQDKCETQMGECSHCGLTSNVYNCQNKGHERIVRRPNENRTIRVTNPNREIGRFRNFKDFHSHSTEECQCCEKPKRQRSKELPYQRLNIFSEVMDELQRKMSESVCCARCWRNPCCCGRLIDKDERKEKRKAENRVKCVKIEKLSKNNLLNCQCSQNPRSEYKNVMQKSIPIRHIGCVCKLTSCRCRKDKSTYRRPLAKCYYCKNLPCTLNKADIYFPLLLLYCILCCSCITVR